MKILLVDDASGVHEYLYRGLVELGHDCDLAMFNDTTKSHISSEINFRTIPNWGIAGKAFTPIMNLMKVLNLPEYDVTSFMHRISFISKPFLLRYIDLPIIANKSNLLSYISLGCDEISYILKNKKLPYSPCSSCEQFDITGKYCININRKFHAKSAINLNRYFNVAVSTAVEYDHINEIFNGPFKKIPFPIDLTEIPWNPACHTKDKLVICHTPTRLGFKGTNIVLEAIEILRSRRNDFHFNLIHGLAWDEYIKQISASDIVIDQVWSQSSGMNGLWLLGMGKIVFSGNTELGKSYFPFGHENPIIDAPPDAKSLAEKLGNILDNKQNIPSMAEKGRQYISEHHNHIKIAQDYIGFWKEHMKLALPINPSET